MVAVFQISTPLPLYLSFLSPCGRRIVVSELSRTAALFCLRFFLLVSSISTTRCI